MKAPFSLAAVNRVSIRPKAMVLARTPNYNPHRQFFFFFLPAVA
jgi:hypothetical protein